MVITTLLVLRQRSRTKGEQRGSGFARPSGMWESQGSHLPLFNTIKVHPHGQLAVGYGGCCLASVFIEPPTRLLHLHRTPFGAFIRDIGDLLHIAGQDFHVSVSCRLTRQVLRLLMRKLRLPLQVMTAQVMDPGRWCPAHLTRKTKIEMPSRQPSSCKTRHQWLTQRM